MPVVAHVVARFANRLLGYLEARLAGRLANHRRFFDRVLGEFESAGRQMAVPALGRTLRKLSGSEVVAAGRAYESGLSLAAVAGDVGVHRVTLGRLLRGAGFEVRTGKRLSVRQVESGVSWCWAGETLAEVASRFGVGPETMRRALVDFGVELRSPGRRSG